jgi:hypothetical protein
MKKLLVPIFLLALLGHPSQAQVYRCIDAAGNEVYNERGGPNCTLLYGSRAERRQSSGGPTATQPALEDQGMATSEGTNLTFLENTSDVVGEQVQAKGRVRNSGSQLLRSVKIVVECYDGEDELVAAETSYTEPQHIPPGGTAEYEITVEHDPRMKRVKTVARWTEEKE